VRGTLAPSWAPRWALSRAGDRESARPAPCRGHGLRVLLGEAGFVFASLHQGVRARNWKTPGERGWEWAETERLYPGAYFFLQQDRKECVPLKCLQLATVAGVCLPGGFPRVLIAAFFFFCFLLNDALSDYFHDITCQGLSNFCFALKTKNSSQLMRFEGFLSQERN